MKGLLVWYDDNNVQHLGRVGITHTLCNRGATMGHMRAAPKVPLGECAECPVCKRIADKGFEQAVQDVLRNAEDNYHKRPNIRTLSEEFAEAILAERGKHEHPLRLELVQLAGICINMIRQIDNGEEFVK